MIDYGNYNNNNIRNMSGARGSRLKSLAKQKNFESRFKIYQSETFENYYICLCQKVVIY